MDYKKDKNNDKSNNKHSFYNSENISSSKRSINNNPFGSNTIIY